MKLTDLPQEPMNRILDHLPAANRVRLAAVSKELHRRVNRVQHGPMSPHPAHDTLREPDANLITHVAQRFTELRDFLLACAANGPIHAAEYNNADDNGPEFVRNNDSDGNTEFNNGMSKADRARYVAQRNLRRDQYARFTKFWETHSKVPSRDAHLIKLSAYNEWGHDLIIGCTIRVSCGPTYHFTLGITWKGKSGMRIYSFSFENQYGFLDLLRLSRHFIEDVNSYPWRVYIPLDANFEALFAAHFNHPKMIINMKFGDDFRKCARLAVVFRKVVTLVYGGTMGKVNIGWVGDAELRMRLVMLLRHNGFEAV